MFLFLTLTEEFNCLFFCFLSKKFVYVQNARSNLRHTRMSYLFTGNNAPDASSECDTHDTSTMEVSEGLGTNDNHDDRVTQQRDVHVAQVNNAKTRDCGHRAGFDAFMTGYCMATYLLQLGKKSDENELTLSSLTDVSNKLSLTKKEVPLQITRSHFIRPSVSHTEKLKRLKEQLVSYPADS